MSIFVNFDVAHTAELFDLLFRHWLDLWKLSTMDDDHSVGQMLPVLEKLRRVFVQHLLEMGNIKSYYGDVT